MSGPWYGVDLDGTLARYPHAGGIGPPVPAMLARVRRWLARGTRVKLFTARAAVPDLIPEVRAWLDDLGLQQVEITCMKDFQMELLYDDRAVSVEVNTGRITTEGHEPL